MTEAAAHFSHPVPPSETANAQALSQTLAHAIRRIRLRFALRYGSTGLLAGAGISAILVGLLRTDMLSLDAWPGGEGFLALPILAGAVLGGLIGAAQRPAPLAVARFLEQRLDLKERLSTALALQEGNDPYLVRQRQDAETHAAALQSADLARAIPLPLPRHGWIALGLVTSVFLAWLLPTLPFFEGAARRAERAAVQQEGERLLRIAKTLDAQGAAKRLPQTQRAVQRIQELGKEMKRGKLTRQKAMIKLAKLTDAMKEQQRTLAGSSSPAGGDKSLPSAGRDLERALQAASALPKEGTNQTGASSNAAKNASNPGGTSAADQAMRQGAQALKQNDAPTLAEQLSRLAQAAERGEPATAAEQQKLARQVEGLGRALENTRLSSASQPLSDAARSLRKGDTRSAAEQLREAARRVNEGTRSAEAANALRSAADALQSSSRGEMGTNEANSEQQGGSGEGQSATPAEEATPGENGEGQGANDAFNSQGQAKGSGQSGEGKGNGNGQGEGTGKGNRPGRSGGKSGTGNGIGSGAGTPTGRRRSGKPGEAGPYDAPGGVQERRPDYGNGRVKQVRSDEQTRLYTPLNSTHVKGKQGRNQGKESVSYFRGAPDKTSASTPYYEVYERYAPAAEGALNREDIPASYKKQVKDYFDSIRPEDRPR